MKALLDLFARHRAGATGIWTLGADPQRVIYLDQGQIAFAQSTHPLDKLTTLLVERGKLTQAQLDYALQNLKPGLSIGRNLIEMGFITQRDLLEMAKAQVERVVWGAMGNLDEEPRFQAQALDASVVRLSLDTPLTLLVGCLHLRDRERLLDLLGPLEQRVRLVTRLDLNLPPDLARVPPILDGQRRLLDLAQETGVEPMRLGAFALFLREMGLAQLTLEDRTAPAPAPPAPALAPAAPAPSPLLASIEAAERPTVDLRHLSGQLDQLDRLEPLADEDLAEPLDLSDELPPDLAGPAEPDLRIQAETSGSFDLPPAPEGSRPRWPLWALLVLLLGGSGGYLGWRWTRPAGSPPLPLPAASTPVPESEVLSRSPRDLPPPSAPVASSPAPVASTATPAAPSTPTPGAAPAPSPAKPPAPSLAPASADPSAASRWATLRRGDWAAATAQGSAHQTHLGGTWVLRLEVACQPETLARAVAAFPRESDLFLVPLRMKDGRTCRQICFGAFRSEAEAQAAADRLPALFREGGNKPRAYQASALPAKQ